MKKVKVLTENCRLIQLLILRTPISSKDELFKQIAFFRFNEKEEEITSLLYEHVLDINMLMEIF